MNPLHHVPELPDVARPPVGHESGAGVGRETLLRKVVVGTGLDQEVLGEQQDVPAPLPERRQPEGHHRQSMIEVLPEAPRPGRGLQVLATGGENQHIHRLVVRAPEPAHHPLLDHREELALKPHR
jgi:hypothetical protein